MTSTLILLGEDMGSGLARFHEDALTEGAKAMRDVHEAFGMADEEVAAWGELVGEASDDFGLRGGIEVDEDVAAEDEILVRRDGIVCLEQIDSLKVHTRADGVFYACVAFETAVALLEVAMEEGGVGEFEAAEFVNGGLRFFEHASGDIGSVDFPRERAVFAFELGHDDADGVDLFAGG